MAETILEIRDLKKHFELSSGVVHAVDGVTFSLDKGKTLGLVGESGCGKTTLGRTILRLIEPTAGEIIFDGVDIAKLSKRDMRKMRREIQIIFQDPFSSLDPRNTVSYIIGEPLRVHKLRQNRAEIEERVLELMSTVGLAERLINSYPHELDGGRRQRIGIARALSLEPQMIICDEPVSALDVSIQAQILNLLRNLQNELGITYIFITHDLSVVNHISNDIAVMYLGQIVEKAPTEELFADPLHPYTKALLSAIPIPDPRLKRERIALKGEITSPINLPDECRFADRCIECQPYCREGIPPLLEVSPGHFVACFNVPVQNS